MTWDHYNVADGGFLSKIPPVPPDAPKPPNHNGAPKPLTSPLACTRGSPVNWIKEIRPSDRVIAMKQLEDYMFKAGRQADLIDFALNETYERNYQSPPRAVATGSPSPKPKKSKKAKDDDEPYSPSQEKGKPKVKARRRRKASPRKKQSLKAKAKPKTKAKPKAKGNAKGRSKGPVTPPPLTHGGAMPTPPSSKSDTASAAKATPAKGKRPSRKRTRGAARKKQNTEG